jgi:hypothetical protein
LISLLNEFMRSVDIVVYPQILRAAICGWQRPRRYRPTQSLHLPPRLQFALPSRRIKFGSF